MPEILEPNHWWCRLLSSLSHFCETLEYFLLLYLVTSLKCLFRKWKFSKKMFCIGVLVTFLNTFAWSLLMLLTLDVLCWQVQLERPQHWMNDGVRISFFLIANYYLLIVLADRNHERTIYEANDTTM